MRVDNELTPVSGTSEIRSAATSAAVSLLSRESEKLNGRNLLSGLPILGLPVGFVIYDIRKKLRAGFERWIFGTRELRIYVLPLEVSSNFPTTEKFRKNSVEDLLQYRRTSLSQPGRQRFLRVCGERLDKGMTVYTYAEDGVLQAYVWADPNPQAYFGSGVDQEIDAVSDSVYVQDIYTNPLTRQKGLGKAAFAQLARDAAAIPGKKTLYMAIFNSNVASRRGAEMMGTVLKTSYFCRTRLGFRKTWKVEHLDKTN